jgi:hypothetical protein
MFKPIVVCFDSTNDDLGLASANVNGEDSPYITTPARNNVRPKSTFTAHGSSKLDPWSPKQHSLPTNWVHIFVLHAPESSRSKSHTNNDRCGRGKTLASIEYPSTPFDNLRNMLNRTPND